MARPIETTEPIKNAVLIDPEPMFDLSPRLFMQFMEPLGSTDASVEAGWGLRSRRLGRSTPRPGPSRTPRASSRQTWAT